MSLAVALDLSLVNVKINETTSNFISLSLWVVSIASYIDVVVTQEHLEGMGHMKKCYTCTWKTTSKGNIHNVAHIAKHSDVWKLWKDVDGTWKHIIKVATST